MGNTMFIFTGEKHISTELLKTKLKVDPGHERG